MKTLDVIKTKHMKILIFGAELVILQTVRTHEVVEINGSFAVISKQRSTAHL